MSRPAALRRLARDERGAALVSFLLWLTILLGLAGLAVDTANAYRERAILQAAADAAATAGALELPDAGAARAEAAAYVGANMSLSDQAIETTLGRWEAENGRFLAGALPLDAVAVRLRRDRDLGNAPPTFLLGLFGLPAWDMSVLAVARAPGSDCAIRARGTLTIHKEGVFGPGVCLYGREGVTLHKNTIVRSGARIGLLEGGDFRPGKGSVIAPGALFEADLLPARALRVAEMIDAWAEGRRLPPGWSSRVVKSLPSKPVARTVYVVDGNLNLKKNMTLEDVVIAARGHVGLGKDATLSASRSCADGPPVGLYATGNLRLKKNAGLSGVDVVAGGNVTADKELAGLSVIMEAAGDIRIKKDPELSECRPRRAMFGLASTQIMR